jgi:UDP-N-acetylglucosamine--N-acetylmuramyl-(pentapeptide) pyrophosphoryl-undecaprenol N-acetylglucosamine transferase
MKTVFIAGGGTGGHVFPGLAVASALKRLADVNVVFVGSPRGLEARLIPQHGYPLELLDVAPMKGGGVSRLLGGAAIAAKATRSAASLVKRFRPSVVLGVGGYAAGPCSLACVRAGVPLAILEPNSLLGLTNRILAPFAKRGYVAWPETARHFRRGAARVVGVPLRAGFDPRDRVAEPGVRRVLVLGGSQGAATLNERLPRALAAVVARVGPIHVVHQTGAERHETVRKAYEEQGIRDAVVEPFLDNVAERMAEADVVVARAGAVTVAEIASLGRASILVPFPHAADDHQTKNAMSLANLGASLCVAESVADVARLAHEISALFTDPARRCTMANAAREHGRPNAASILAEDLLRLGAIEVRSTTRGTNGQASFHDSYSNGKAVS